VRPFGSGQPFALPFGVASVVGYEFPAILAWYEPPRRRWQKPAGWVLVATAGAAALYAGGLGVAAHLASEEANDAASQDARADANRRRADYLRGTWIMGGVAGGAALAGAVLLLVSDRADGRFVSVSPGGGWGGGDASPTRVTVVETALAGGTILVGAAYADGSGATVTAVTCGL
jgi:hypothetical protein